MSKTERIAWLSDGDDKSEIDPTTAPAGGDGVEEDSAYFGKIVAQRMERRAFLKGAGLGTGALAVPALLSAKPAQAGSDPGKRLSFTAIAPTDVDSVVVPAGYTSSVVIAWGDPLLPGAAAFDVNAQTAAKQASQFGFNCDFVTQLPLPAWCEALASGPVAVRGLGRWLLGTQFEKLRHHASPTALLWVNHEYSGEEDMLPGYISATPTKEQADIGLAAHGGSVVLIREKATGWGYDKHSPFNRRITGETPIAITGPLAGHPLVQTAEDPAGRTVKGMLNNCGGGMTPWGTVLTAEENFDQYFGGRTKLTAANPAKAALYGRLPAQGGESERKWERHHPRFDVSLHPNEYARFGYVVEIDPYDPTSIPKKRTALGRFKHEAAVPTLAADDRVVLYSGDDARFEYAYKFITKKAFNPWDRQGNLELLDEGTLYVAKFNADGTGVWLPLVHGTGPLTATNGFPSQAEVIVNTRGAADKLGATKMDRPEDIEVSPATGKVYIALTNNSARTTVAGDTGEAAANPRLNNRWGHVVEITEDDGDNASLGFRWEIFLLAGDPALTQGTYFAGFDPSRVSPISCPDNLDFDEVGNLWIATDGAPNTPGFSARNDGIFAVPTEGSDRGHLRQFLSGPKGCEVAALRLSTDNRTLFASIQHPGEGGGLPNPQSSWPDGTNLPPRPAVVAVKSLKNRKIGS
ncbi:MAG TPA: PhoX family phosphatase [Polyangia bacterium]